MISKHKIKEAFLKQNVHGVMRFYYLSKWSLLIRWLQVERRFHIYLFIYYYFIFFNEQNRPIRKNEKIDDCVSVLLLLFFFLLLYHTKYGRVFVIVYEEIKVQIISKMSKIILI